MNNFTKVLWAIKQYCEDPELQKNNDCFTYIAQKTNVPLNRISEYLESLQALGLIKYSLRDRTIQLTPTGIQKDKVF